MVNITQTCAISGKEFVIDDVDQQFYAQMAPKFGDQTFELPLPTLCPEERRKQRLIFSNEFFFYKGQSCGLCKKSVLTYFPPEANRKVYCRDCWMGDQWDPRDYGRDYDFDRPFFEQYADLIAEVPTMYLNISGTVENCDYMHCAGFSKNCYLIAHADYCEDCYYGYGFKKNLNCVDGFYNLHCQYCYDSVYVHKSYGLVACMDCVSCSNSYFCKDCVGCKDCFMCSGMRQKQYCIRNKQYTREQYEAEMAKIDLGSHAQYEKYKAEFLERKSEFPVKYYQGIQTENCSGNYLQKCKNAQDCYDCEEVEDCRYCSQLVLGSKNSQDVYQYGTGISWCYECSVIGDGSSNCLFSHQVFVNAAYLYYCWFMHTCKHCFGCTNMNHNQYCILNKQYSKEEYEALMPRVIEHMKSTGEWGKQMPVSLSPFSYQKSNSQFYFPLSKQQALDQGYHWHPDPASSTTSTVLKPDEIPDNIKDVKDNICQSRIECKTLKKPFGITPQELAFYRKQGLPIPRKCVDQRFFERFSLRNPRNLWNRQCAECQAGIQTSYAPDRPEKVLCEKCYQKTVL